MHIRAKVSLFSSGKGFSNVIFSGTTFQKTHNEDVQKRETPKKQNFSLLLLFQIPFNEGFADVLGQLVDGEADVIGIMDLLAKNLHSLF